MAVLRDYQLDAVQRMKNGCILCGGVGSGKSRTSLGYYAIQNGSKWGNGNFTPMKNPKNLFIITTARKRDQHEWEDELCLYHMSPKPEASMYQNEVVIDSWNNIKKYVGVSGAFFIFDEQRVVGSGQWVKSFLKICKNNEWILLSATPGDRWTDYIPVFIANGFYKNRTEFVTEHVIYKRFSKFPQVDRYINTGRLIRLRDRILVTMDFDRPTESHHIDVYSDYDVMHYKEVMRDRWNPYKSEPIRNASELCAVLREIVNSDESKQVALLEILETHPRAIIFYNYNYELDILKNLYYGENVEVAEWNGHAHQEIPSGDNWIYLVQYNAGAEGWNCILTDTIIFYSANYSYKIMEQSAGRIARMNTPFHDLYYYHMKTRSPIDLSINRALSNKKKFSESAFYNKFTKAN